MTAFAPTLIDPSAAPARAEAVVQADAPHLPGLDRLRGLAILMVLPHNLVGATEATGLLSKVVLGALERGWIGVHLFFALSGFLITGILLDTARCRNGLRVFYARRVLRIFPLYFAVLAVCLLLLPMLGWPPRPLHDGPGLWASYWVFLSNWVEHAAGEGSLPHLWSLAVEEQFYLLWPLLVYRQQPRRVVAFGLLLMAVSLLARLVMLGLGASGDVVYQATLSRIGTLVLGGAAAAALREPTLEPWLVHHRRWLPRVAVGALVLAALAGHLHAQGPWSQTLGYDLLSVACVAGLVSVALRDRAAWVLADAGVPVAEPGRLRRRLDRLLRGAGRYSYGAYLLHVPVALFVLKPALAELGYRTAPGETGELLAGWPLAAAIMLGITLTFAAAYVSYHGLEKRALALKPAYQR